MTSNPTGLLGDTVTRDYAHKLRLFNTFAEPELRQAVASLGIERGMRILDAGCGTGAALGWLASAVGPQGLTVGLELASAHVAAARAVLSTGTALLQADVQSPPLASGSFDLIWAVNTIHHLRHPAAALDRLKKLLRTGGRVALGQSSLLPDMYFAWDSRLERVTNEAVRRYYRDRYRIDERELTGVRAIVGLLRRASLREVSVRTLMIERIAPLRPADEEYLLEGIFRATWGERLRPYLSGEDYTELTHLCDPQHRGYALRRADFHFLQSFTLAVGKA
jgi:SAM-dependent methyltransferase